VTGAGPRVTARRPGPGLPSSTPATRWRGEMACSAHRPPPRWSKPWRAGST